jgi:hypothetical protein
LHGGSNPPLIAKTKHMTPHNTTPQFNDIDYKIGDIVVNKDNPNKEIGECTGFLHNNTCVEIDGKCYGGRIFFMKSEWVECEVI